MLTRTSDQVWEKFQRLAAEWHNETAHLSSLTAMVMHPAYQRIIGMGPDVLPVLFESMRHEPDYWFWALTAITEVDPVVPEDYGDLDKMTETWLQWAREQTYL
jgi:hypothetical protein